MIPESNCCISDPYCIHYLEVRYSDPASFYCAQQLVGNLFFRCPEINEIFGSMVSKVNEQINDPNNQSLLHREQHLEAIINIAEVIFRLILARCSDSDRLFSNFLDSQY